MIISCSSKEEIWNIPISGKARIAGYWDPETVPVYKPTLIKWEEGKLQSLEELSKDNVEEHLIDWRDFFLFPGWIDAHVHLALDSLNFNECIESWKNNSIVYDKIKDSLRRYSELGIVAIRDGGDLTGYGWLTKKRVEDKEWIGPVIQSVREAVFKKGLYGSFLGEGILDINHWRDSKESFFDKGLDQLKVIVSGLISFRKYGVVGKVQWNLEELREIVNDAHEKGISVMAHVSGIEGITKAISAGVDSIEHGYYISSEHIKEMTAKGIAWVPTVAPVGNLVTRVTHRYSLEEKKILRKILKEHLDSILKAYQSGVRLGIGTDAGAYLVPHGNSILDEMTWFAEAGIPTIDVRRIATLENARIVGLTGFGRLRPGINMDRFQLSDNLLGSFY